MSTSNEQSKEVKVATPKLATPSRFDYVAYDDVSQMKQATAKLLVQQVETMINNINSPRAKALAHTALEETYMWIGKGIRDDQQLRDLNTKLQEKRNNS